MQEGAGYLEHGDVRPSSVVIGHLLTGTLLEQTFELAFLLESADLFKEFPVEGDLFLRHFLPAVGAVLAVELKPLVLSLRLLHHLLDHLSVLTEALIFAALPLLVLNDRVLQLRLF